MIPVTAGTFFQAPEQWSAFNLCNIVAQAALRFRRHASALSSAA
jgi:hypothetical protein